MVPSAPIQEVFKLCEEREGRIVVALDFNSMYGGCMDGVFPDPRTLKYVEFKDNVHDVGELQVGVYHAILSGPKSGFINSYHPFKVHLEGRRFPFSLGDEDGVESLFFENELAFYSLHFNSVEVLSGVVSDSGMKHPLSSMAKKLYQQRKVAKLQGKDVKSRVLKMQVAALYSVTSRRRYRERRFNNVSEALSVAEDAFQLAFPEGMGMQEKIDFLSSSGLMVMRRRGNSVRARFVDHAAADSVHCLSARVVANARLKLLGFIENLLEIDGLEVCYVNSDCVHVSIEKCDYNKLLECIDYCHSDEMGDVRIQCVADRGYWLDVGRYWLMHDDGVAKYTNKVFNHPGSSDPFLRVRGVGRVFRGEYVDFVIRQYQSIERSFSFSKKICGGVDGEGFVRYKIGDLIGPVAGGTVERDRAFSDKAKLDIFNRIATGKVSPTRGGCAAVTK